MATPQLGNCPKCGKLFLRTAVLCGNCYQKQEEDYLKVAAYLRDHSGGAIQELSEATEVSVAQIRQFILAERILVSHFPNLSYPCDTCGRMIRTGKTCPSCLGTLDKLAKHVEKDEKTRILEQKDRSGGYISRFL